MYYNPVYEAVFNAHPYSLFILDDRIKIISCNEASTLIFGEQLVGQYIIDILDGDNLSPILSSVINGAISSCSVAVTGIGSVKTSFNATIQRVILNDVILLLVALTDSSSVVIEPRIADFISNAGHEIRTPITSLLAMIETLASENWENRDTIDLFAPMMLKQTIRLKSLVADLLNLSKMSVQQAALPHYTVNLVEVIEVLNLQLSKSLKEYKLSLVLKKEGDVYIQGDFHELSLMYHNIISNAIRHSNPDGKIIVEIGYTSDLPNTSKYIQGYSNAAYVRIIDEGDGIPDEHIPRLTEEFYKVDTARSAKQGGFGLGLSVAQQVLSRHNGILDIQSKIGGGSVFTTYFGLKRDDK